jgi:hypothetical protein
VSHFIKHERCPKCSRMGNDRSGNNLAVYSDGHKHCFACGYYVRGDIVETYKQNQVKELVKDARPMFYRSNVFDTRGLVYLKKYGLTDKEIYDNYFWDNNGYLVFNGNEYQNARNFTGIGVKYISRGIIRGNEKIFLRNAQNECIVVAEDAISAIKIARQYNSVPIHNSIIPLELILRLSKRFKNLFIWLDRDKAKESFKEAKKAELYFDKVNIIWSEKDPKEYSDSEIKNYIEKD